MRNKTGKKSTRLNRTKKRFKKIFGPNIVLLFGPLGNNKKTPDTKLILLTNEVVLLELKRI